MVGCSLWALLCCKSRHEGDDKAPTATTTTTASCDAGNCEARSAAFHSQAGTTACKAGSCRLAKYAVKKKEEAKTEGPQHRFEGRANCAVILGLQKPPASGPGAEDQLPVLRLRLNTIVAASAVGVVVIVGMAN
jgi:hypothetical protein